MIQLSPSTVILPSAVPAGGTNHAQTGDFPAALAGLLGPGEIAAPTAGAALAGRQATADTGKVLPVALVNSDPAISGDTELAWLDIAHTPAAAQSASLPAPVSTLTVAAREPGSSVATKSDATLEPGKTDVQIEAELAGPEALRGDHIDGMAKLAHDATVAIPRFRRHSNDIGKKQRTIRRRSRWLHQVLSRCRLLHCFLDPARPWPLSLALRPHRRRLSQALVRQLARPDSPKAARYPRSR